MNTKVTARVMTGLVGIPLLILIIGWGRPWHFSLLMFVVTAVSLAEYFFIAFPKRKIERIFGIFFGLLISFTFFIPASPQPGLWLSGGMMAAFMTYLFLDGSLEERYRHLVWTLLGVVYIGYLLPHFVLLYRSPAGREWVFFVLLVVMMGDTAAYFAGGYWGRKKLAPHISPGKTVEGAIASFCASAMAGVIGGKFLLPDLSGPEMLLLSLVLSALGQIGDLFESWIKRVFSVKDSSTLLPGHGGLLDRLDSLIFPVVFTAYYRMLLHP